MGVDAKFEAKFGSHPIEEGEVSLDEVAPLPLQGSTKLSMEGGPTLEIVM